MLVYTVTDYSISQCFILNALIDLRKKINTRCIFHDFDLDSLSSVKIA